MASRAANKFGNTRLLPKLSIHSKWRSAAISNFKRCYYNCGFKGDQNPHKPNRLDPSDDAIAFDSNGLHWLRVKGLRDELAYPVCPLTFEQLGECYVRANLKYVAPINPDSIPKDAPFRVE